MINKKFEIGFKKVENKTKFFIKLFNKELHYNLGEPVIFYWKEDFQKYFSSNNMIAKVDKLKKGLDEISCEYIDMFMKNSKYWDGTLKRNIWTKYDKILIAQYHKFTKNFKQPFDKIAKFNEFIFSNKYGLSDLPKEIYNKIDKKLIIDAGGYNGDTAYMFHQNFPNSDILVYEPLSVNIQTINKILEQDKCDNKIIPIKKGLGNKKEILEISFNDTEISEIATIDNEINNLEKKPVGLIKLDTEGFESKIIEGAIETIKRDTPILLIAIYHTPEDFFEMKAKLEELNLGYKFMIRRSEAILPQADLVLIAYPAS